MVFISVHVVSVDSIVGCSVVPLISFPPLRLQQSPVYQLPESLLFNHSMRHKENV